MYSTRQRWLSECIVAIYLSFFSYLSYFYPVMPALMIFWSKSIFVYYIPIEIPPWLGDNQIHEISRLKKTFCYREIIRELHCHDNTQKKKWYKNSTIWLSIIWYPSGYYFCAPVIQDPGSPGKIDELKVHFFMRRVYPRGTILVPFFLWVNV